jgi:hypothetical protein
LALFLGAEHGVSNNGTAASATNGVHLGVGEVIDLEVTEANGLLAITST